MLQLWRNASEAPEALEQTGGEGGGGLDLRREQRPTGRCDQVDFVPVAVAEEVQVGLNSTGARWISSMIARDGSPAR